MDRKKSCLVRQLTSMNEEGEAPLGKRADNIGWGRIGGREAVLERRS